MAVIDPNVAEGGVGLVILPRFSCLFAEGSAVRDETVAALRWEGRRMQNKRTDVWFIFWLKIFRPQLSLSRWLEAFRLASENRFTVANIHHIFSR